MPSGEQLGIDLNDHPDRVRGQAPRAAANRSPASGLPGTPSLLWK
jgi:hypothetical protein